MLTVTYQNPRRLRRATCGINARAVLAHIEAFNSNQSAGETINNVYELPSLACAVQYLHAAAGFPTKATWLKSIRNGKYLTWSLLTIKNVNRHFLESEDTQKGHMRHQC